MGKLNKLLSRLGLNGFLVGILASIGLAAVFPEFGSANSGFPWKPIIQVGIGLLFFLYGLKLDPVQLRSGLSNWKLHLLIQATTFLVFPIIIFSTLYLFPNLDPNLALGIRFLSALPSTVSASVVLVAIARGNVAATIFNASLSSLLGIVLTPLWMKLASVNSAAELDLAVAFQDLSFKVLVPVVLGVSLHKYIFPRLKNVLTRLKSVILILVFTTFSESFSQGAFNSFPIKNLITLFAGISGIVILAQVALYFSAFKLGFSKEDRITALFCGSTKSLVHGVAIGKVLFPSSSLLGLVLLPIMMYHLQQLILGSFLARRFEKNKP
jgi:sodium/bile acid cotransporter 7